MSLDSKDPAAVIHFVEALKRKWMATVDAIVDPLMLIDRDFIIRQANRALADHANAKDIRELVGKKCYIAFAGRKKPCPGCRVKETFDQNQSTQFELEKVLEDRFYEVTSQPIIDQEGHLEGVLHIYRDRTLARQLQSQLLQNEKLASIGLLAGGIAHEINNPLGGILIFSQMLLREMSPESPHYQDVREIEAATQRCKGIVESLLDFARQQPGIGQESSPEEVDLKQSMRSALTFVSFGGAAHHISVHEFWPEEPIMIMGNRNKTIQVFLNLIQNAVHAMPEGGDLSLRLYYQIRKNQQYVIAEVEDTGIGIAPHDLKKIFDPFYTSKAEGQGTGLGLSICHGIAEDMGGTIEVESRLNKGSCFRFLVPAARKVTQTAS